MKKLPTENHEEEVQIDQMSFESAFKELDAIVAALETEEKPLEEALTLFERGQELARHCAELLDRAELRVKVLAGETLSDFSREPGE